MASTPALAPAASQPGYWAPVWRSLRTLWAGLRLTWAHSRRRRRAKLTAPDAPAAFDQTPGAVTIQYPAERLPAPDVGRYRLHMETEDCIGCDQCARICPVDCIDIVKIKAVEPLGTATDGSKKTFYLPTFDIDMAKCCFCGLCTVVCPTECLTMTPVYDYAETDVRNFIYHFGNLGPEEAAQKQAELEQHEAERQAARQAALKAKADASPASQSPPSQQPA